MQGFIRAWLGGAPDTARGVRVQVDIDPQSFLWAAAARPPRRPTCALPCVGNCLA